MSLTARQEQVLSFIRTFAAEHSYPPTIAEISRGLGLKAPNAAICHLYALERKKLIKRDRSGRTIVVL